MITLDDFFNKSTLIENVRSNLRLRSSLKDVVAVPFLTKYLVKINDNGGAVFDGIKLIASIGRLNDLVVDPAYRGQGIATNLILQWIIHNSDFKAEFKPIRTAFGQKAYTEAWKLYQQHLTVKP